MEDIQKTTHHCEAGCGRIISLNKIYCLACEESRHAIAKATVGATYTLVRLRQKHVDTLCRDSDGMIVAQRQAATVLVGANLKDQNMHGFIDEDSAIRFIRSLHPILEERDGENLVVPANGLLAQARN